MYVRLLLGLLCVLGCSQLADASPFAYVANYNGKSVTVVDLNNTSNPATLQLSGAQAPYGVAVNKFGSRVYVSDRLAPQVFVIDTSNNSVSVIPVPFKPSGLAVNPAGTRLYVANVENASVSVIDTVTRAVVKTVAAGTGPQGVAVSPAGDKVYVANSSRATGVTSNTVSVFNATADSMNTLATINVDAAPMGIAVNPAGTRLYVACADTGSVNVIDTATNAVTATIAGVGSIPFGVAVNPDGSEVYVSLSGDTSGTPAVGKLAVIRTSDNTKTGTVNVGPTAMGVAVTPTGVAKIVSANNEGASISVVNAATKATDATVTVGDGPQSLGNFVGPELVAITFTTPSFGTIAPADLITVDANGVALAPKGFDMPLSVVPDPNHVVGSVTLNGTTTLTAPYKITNVTAPGTVDATFTRVARTVTLHKVYGTGATGRLSIAATPALSCLSACTDASQAYPIGTELTITAEPDSGTVFQGWGGGDCVNGINANVNKTGVSTCTFSVPGNYFSSDGEMYVDGYFALPLVSSFQSQYDNLPSAGGPIACNASYTSEPIASFYAGAAKAVTVTPAVPSTTLNLPAGTSSGKFTVGLGSVTFSGGGTFIIN